MKFNIGSRTFAFAEKPPARPSEDELGGTGTTFFGGSLSENEYNTDLRGSKGLVIYDKMRRSDAMVNFALSACELPIRAATWKIEPASEDKPDVDIAAALEQNLFNMSITWDSFIHHVCLMLPYGWMAFEKVWEVADGQIRYRKLAPRLPSTLYKWNLDENGGLVSMEQSVWKGSAYSFVTIPADKLLIFTNAKEGSNFEGISILRSAYKHWYYKDNLYRIDGIAAERHALGVPYFTTPASASKDDKDRIDAIAQRLYAQEQAFVRLAEGFGFDVKGLSGTIKDIMPSIQHHDKKIAESVLADFIDLGGADRGSWALSKDKSSFFLMALRAVVTNICDTMNAYAIKPWVDYNYAGVEQYPKLKAGNLETRDMQLYAQAISQLVTAGVINYNRDTENSLRDMLHLPLLPEKHAQQSERQIFKGVEKRALTPAEQSVDFGEIARHLDTAEEQFVAACKEIMTQQIENIADTAAKVIENKQLNRVDGLQVRYSTQMADKIYTVLKGLFDYGRQQVQRELVRQAGGAMSDPEPLHTAGGTAVILELLKARAKAAANVLANKIKQFVTFEVLRQIKQGIVDIPALKQGMLDLSDKELLTTAQYSVSEAFNYGRAADAANLNVQTCQYSAIMDDNTCSVCDKMDGQEWPYEDPRTDQYAGGNPDCLGGGRCRCLLVYIYKPEVNPNG